MILSIFKMRPDGQESRHDFRNQFLAVRIRGPVGPEGPLGQENVGVGSIQKCEQLLKRINADDLTFLHTDTFPTLPMAQQILGNGIPKSEK